MADNLENLICPACGAELVKCFDSENNFHIDICINGCGGIYFDNREVEKYDEPHEDIQFILDLIKDKTFEPTDTSKERVCPACQYPMVKIGTGIDDVEIDVCNTCGAKFFDNNELQKIRTVIVEEDKNLPEILENIWEKTMLGIIREEKLESFKRKPRRQVFGEILSAIIKKHF